MKKFLRGYPEILSGDENSVDSLTKIDIDSLYSEFQQPGILSSFEDSVETEDISEFLKRTQVHKITEENPKNKRCNQ